MRQFTILAAVVFALQAVIANHVLHAENAIVLSGVVSSAEEGPMEGVVVSAKRDGSTITTSVVTDEKGRFNFPQGRLPRGNYALQIRAVGYELTDKASVELGANTLATQDLYLRKTENLAEQLTNAEWLISMPGSEAQKAPLIRCVSCHILALPNFSHHTASEFQDILVRMANYAQVSFPLLPQIKVVDPELVARERFKGVAEYLATLNLNSRDRWTYELRTLPRLKGKSTHVIITEYDMPRPVIQPHDVIVSRGQVWYSDFGQQFLGKLDPATGKVVEYPLPMLKPAGAKGTLDLREDKDGGLWISMMYQGGIARFDRAPEKFQILKLPDDIDHDMAQMTMLAPQHSDVDGKVWFVEAGNVVLGRVDLNTGKYEAFQPDLGAPKGHDIIYGIFPDANNNIFFANFGTDEIGRIDAKSGAIARYKTPTPNSQPRRGVLDNQGRFWFAEYRGNRIGVFDPKTEQIQEWEMPSPWSTPYDVVVDKNGDVWTGGMSNDRLSRLNPKSGQFTEYPLPHETNIRRMFIDESSTVPALWIGSNHGASIVKVEVLD